MNLLTGLAYYKEVTDSDWQFTLEVEARIARVKGFVLCFGSAPPNEALEDAWTTLLEIEKWKAMCLKERMGQAARNSKQAVWEAFRGAVAARDDLTAIRSIMQLKGFGATADEETGQRRAKVATAVLRFLFPNDWGVVDWRTVAMLTQLEKTNGDPEKAVAQAKRLNSNEMRMLFDIIDELGACEINQKYRSMRTEPSFTRTADVEMAIFGLSILAWPFRSGTIS